MNALLAALISIAMNVISASSFASPGEDQGRPCKKNEAPVLQIAPPVQAVVDALSVETQPHWVDASFLFEAEKLGDVVHVEGFNPAQAVPSGTQQTFVSNLLTASLGNTTLPGTTTVTNFNQSMSLLSQEGASMSTQEKLLYLSMLGSALAQGYNATGLDSKTDEQIWENAHTGGQAGGICGNIHDYLSAAAVALGFRNAGIISGVWNQSGSAGNHYVARFQDPSTGDYYVLNYSSLIDTHQKTLQGAVEVATRTLGPLTGVSSVEGRPGVFHMYVPMEALWLESELARGTDFRSHDPVVRASIGTIEQTVVVQGSTEVRSGIDAKGFFVHSSRDEVDGRYQVDALGIAAQSELSSGPRLNSLINELNLTSKVYGGGLQIAVPGVAGYVGPGQQSNLFFGGNVKGTARINSVTGKLEINGETLDFMTPGMAGGMAAGSALLQIRPGFEYRKSGSSVSYQAERLFEVVPVSNAYFDPGLRTTYDRFSVVVDTRGAEDKAYLVNRSDVYVFEGLGNRAARGLRERVRAAIPAGNLGEFGVVAEISKVVSNPSQDPFYDVPMNASLGVTWRKIVGKAVEIGAGVDVANHAAPYIFLDPNDPGNPAFISPALVDLSQRQLRGSVWVRSGF